MTPTVRALAILAAWALVAGAPAASGAKPSSRAGQSSAAKQLELFDSPIEALQSILLTRTPKVIGFGEFHEIEGAPKVRSSLVHFRDELLPMLAPLASDLVLETWVTQGNCGKEETEVVEQV